MKKVYQTIIDVGKGNCMQAAIASLFELELDDVPNFKEEPNWVTSMFYFVQKYDYEIDGTFYNKTNGIWNGTLMSRYQNRFESINDMEGVNGYFYAVVYSPKYHMFAEHPKDAPTHAVIIDKDFNVVHDPNPENKGIEKYPYADIIGYNGVIDILIINPISK